MRPRTTVTNKRPQVVIVGGGFGGLAAAQSLAKAPVDITLIDRTNHSVFFPLLYQVATGGLSADEIASPIRSLVRNQRNTKVLMTEVTGVDREQQQVITKDGKIDFDYLILATGVRYSYFGHPEWEQYAPSMKSIPDAAAIRRRTLNAFERAELSNDQSEIDALLTFVLVGGGPTGVEMAGALAELARMGLADEYRSIDPRSARIILLEGGSSLLKNLPAPLGDKAQAALERIGVEVRLNARVTNIDETGVTVGDDLHIPSKSVIWTAGVEANPAGEWLGAEVDRIGRVKVGQTLALPDAENIFVIGDAASFEQDGALLPGVAQVAMQGGKYVGDLIKRRSKGQSANEGFRYMNLGDMATVGRSFAVADFGWLRTSGFFTWLLWLGLHVYYLAGLRNRMQVMLQWTWAYFTYQRNVRVLNPELVAGAPAKQQLEPAKVPVKLH